jgi:hypothetical protein
MSDYEREHERIMRELEEGREEPVETLWIPLTDGERLAAHNAATRLVDDAGDLTDFARQVLEFEKHWWKYAGAKETQVRDRWEISSTRYYQLLNALIDQPAAYVAEPLLVKRLSRLRTARRNQRRVRQDGGQ